MNRIAGNAQCAKCAKPEKAFEYLRFSFFFNALRECSNARCTFQSCISNSLIAKGFSYTRNAPLTGGVRAPPLARLRARPACILFNRSRRLFCRHLLEIL